MINIIDKKKNGETLSRDEIDYVINGYVSGEIPDYQVSALLMAIYFRGLSDIEVFDLTESMLNTGETYSLSQIDGIKVDKHSTGGIGDKTTMIVAPLMAAGGLKVAKMSGKGLGHTGGTIDKFSAIPGFKYEIDRDDFIAEVNQIGLAICGQSGNLVPADKKLYALRDVTATVDSLPLVASSIMSKKLAMDTDIIVLDVKYGVGAFMANIDEAIALANIMIKIGTLFNRKVSAIISDMNTPLGYNIGNSLEVVEAFNMLCCGESNAALKEVCLALSGMAFNLAGMAVNVDDGIAMADEILSSGKALDKFLAMVNYQCADKEYSLDNFIMSLPKSRYVYEICANKSGYVNAINSRNIGIASVKLGAGREKLDDLINYSVGIILKVQLGDFVEIGDVLCCLHSDDEDIEKIKKLVVDSFIIADKKNAVTPHIEGVVDLNGFRKW